MEKKVYYFGCANNRAGHYMHNIDLEVDNAFFKGNPWGTEIDRDLPQGKEQVEGAAAIHYKGGWTALAFWDRSEDKRFGSQSIFLAEGILNFEEMITLARQKFPTIMERFTFPIQKTTGRSLS